MRNIKHKRNDYVDKNRTNERLRNVEMSVRVIYETRKLF